MPEMQQVLERLFAAEMLSQGFEQRLTLTTASDPSQERSLRARVTAKNWLKLQATGEYRQGGPLLRIVHQAHSCGVG